MKGTGGAPDINEPDSNHWYMRSPSFLYFRLSIYISIYRSIYLIYLFIYLSIYLSIYISVFMVNWIDWLSFIWLNLNNICPTQFFHPNWTFYTICSLLFILARLAQVRWEIQSHPTHPIHPLIAFKHSSL